MTTFLLIFKLFYPLINYIFKIKIIYIKLKKTQFLFFLQNRTAKALATFKLSHQSHTSKANCNQQSPNARVCVGERNMKSKRNLCVYVGLGGNIKSKRMNS